MSFTFSMIKPTAVEQGLVGAILTDIERSGFKIKKLKMINMDRALVEKFYESLNTKPFFGELCDYAISGPVVAMVLEKDNAVQDFRQLIGATDFKEANYGTIRKNSPSIKCVMLFTDLILMKMLKEKRGLFLGSSFL